MSSPSSYVADPVGADLASQCWTRTISKRFGAKNLDTIITTYMPALFLLLRFPAQLIRIETHLLERLCEPCLHLVESILLICCWLFWSLTRRLTTRSGRFSWVDGWRLHIHKQFWRSHQRQRRQQTRLERILRRIPRLQKHIHHPNRTKQRCSHGRLLHLLLQTTQRTKHMDSKNTRQTHIRMESNLARPKIPTILWE